MKKSILILLMILIFILPSCSSHETTDCRIVLERLMTAEIGLPAGKVYCMAAQRGDDEYLPQNLINSLYGNGSRPVMADGWIDLAVYLSTTPHPCELAVFLCDKEETARDFAKKHGMGIDFNPTFFSHPMVKDNLTLSSPDEATRKYWIDHGKACIKISEYFARETGIPCVMNIWIPDGYKDVPADRYSPRARFAASLDEILDTPYDKSLVYVTLESKVFGIGLESYTVGSAEFCLSYSTKKGITPLMDNGHYHPTEVVSDKIPSLLVFNEKIALHITRCVRWDSDHVVALDDETKEIAKEIVRCGALDRVFIALDYFDASINRIAAWTIGMRNVQKALLAALLTPSEKMKAMQDAAEFTALLALSEEVKTLPLGAVWDEYLERCGVPAGMDWFDKVCAYENEILAKRQ